MERGQKLANADGSGFVDLSVEELCATIKALGPDDSAVEAVQQGLKYLDSGALAALLKVGCVCVCGCVSVVVWVVGDLVGGEMMTLC